MGCCQSEEQKHQNSKNKKVQQLMQQEQISEERQLKLLLLGTGESGKSTIFKQMQILYTAGFSAYEKQRFTKVIKRNIVEGMQVIIDGVEEFGFKYGSDDAQHAAEYLNELDHLSPDFWAEEVPEYINILWTKKDPAIMKAWDNRAKLQLAESVSFFFDDVDRISAVDFEPEPLDILRARLRTSGIVERTFKIKDAEFKFLDVGGQRNERRKWIHCFEDVTAVIFVAAISEYDQVLFEDEKQNRLHESVRVFGNICNNQYFTDTAMILFLNKDDLFREKLTKVPFNVCFEEYEGDNSYNEVREFIADQYKANKRDHGEIFVHYTTATDTQLIKRVWDSCKQVVLRKNLEKLGLA